jgi:hypothetical protein
MNKIESQIVEYKHASILERIGFNEPCFGVFDSNLEFKLDYRETQYDAKKGWNGNFILAPTYEQVFKFFRDEYGVFVEFHLEGALGNPIGYSASIDVKGGRHLFPWEIVESGEVLTYEKLRPIVLNFCIEIVFRNKC